MILTTKTNPRPRLFFLGNLILLQFKKNGNLSNGNHNFLSFPPAPKVMPSVITKHVDSFATSNLYYKITSDSSTSIPQTYYKTSTATSNSGTALYFNTYILTDLGSIIGYRTPEDGICSIQTSINEYEFEENTLVTKGKNKFVSGIIVDKREMSILSDYQMNFLEAGCHNQTTLAHPEVSVFYKILLSNSKILWVSEKEISTYQKEKEEE